MKEQKELNETNAGRRVTHLIPVSLEAMKDTLPVALMYLYHGEMPKATPEGEIKKLNFWINPKSEAFITRLTPEFGSRTQVIIHALAWAAELNDRQKLMLISTKL
jgi:hypothetical protein